MTIEELEEKANEPYSSGKVKAALFLLHLLLLTFSIGVAVGYVVL